MNLPFFASPGLDPDAWRVLLAARHIAEHHTYIASRLPGYPVLELVFSLFAHMPTWVSILPTFLVSLVGFFSFYKILEGIGLKNRLLLTLSFAFTPVVLVNCLTTMDYVWAISFALFSFFLVTRKQYLVAGLFLGVAVGCRVTTALMMIPFCSFVWASQIEPRRRVTECALFLLSTLVVSIVCYGPVVSTYGPSFLHHSAGGPIQTITLAKTVSVDTFGIIGVLAIVAALIVQAVMNDRRGTGEHSVPGSLKNVCWLVIGLFGVLFLWMPLEAGYLIALLPFALMLARFYLTSASFKTLAYGLIISSILVSVDSKDRAWSAPSSPASFRLTFAGRALAVDFFYGPLTLDFLKRKSQLAYADSVIVWAHAQNDSAVLVTGVWLPQLTYLTHNPMGRTGEEGFELKNVTVIGLLDRSRAEACRRMGRRILYLPGQDRYTNEVYGINIEEFGGRELDLSRPVLYNPSTQRMQVPS